MRAAFYTLGCKVNQYETQILQQHFAREGYEIVDFEEEADVYVVNSCTVTATGDKKSRKALRACLRRNPGAVGVLTGCFPQAFPEEATAFLEAKVVAGARDRNKLLRLVEHALRTGERVVDIPPHERGEAFEEMQAERFLERTRAFVKIEDGCENWCSYCIIPKARGPIRSKPLDSLGQELASLAQAGYREAVLTGINLSSYGKDLGLRLADAVEAACAVEGLARVRLSSLEPELLTEEDIARLANCEKLCPQFHLALQSGCDETLRRMNRHYDRAEYARIVASLRARFPGASFTTDMMVGFPGETEEEFAQSLAFAEEIGFAKVHVFAYSPRPGTRAAALPEQVSAAEKSRRSAALAAACQATRARFLAAQVGSLSQVLFETHSEPQGWFGYTENYTPVYVASGKPLAGQVHAVRITSASEDFCLGELVSSH